MLTTALCDLLKIDIPIIQASFGPWSRPELVAASSNAGAVGSLGTVLRSPDRVRSDIRRVRELTDKPFIVNFSMKPFNPESFDVALEERVAAVSLAHGDPRELPKQAHDAGARFIHMVNTVSQAREASSRGVDAIIAQGSESAGFSGDVSTLCLLPQVVDAVGPLPVVASGGIADGRGLAVALLLGAAGVNIGTRFLASSEAGVSESWQRRVLEAESEDAVKLTFSDAIIPPIPGTYEAVPRVLRSPFVDEWNPKPIEAMAASERLAAQVIPLIRESRGDDLIAFTGQTAGMIREVVPVADIVRRMVYEAEDLLRGASKLAGDG